jgi:hypothetical protein
MVGEGGAGAGAGEGAGALLVAAVTVLLLNPNPNPNPNRWGLVVAVTVLLVVAVAALVPPVPPVLADEAVNTAGARSVHAWCAALSMLCTSLVCSLSAGHESYIPVQYPAISGAGCTCR